MRERGRGQLLPRLALEQAIADEAHGAPRPGVISAHAKPAVSPGNDGAGPGVAELESDRVFGAAHPSHQPISD
jgi:hypothetical protein